ncbi:MAG: membrane protein insertase YidC [Promicromonosporaceae bacterium]|nr:membrane protein insertase YidC [Promicromonosporaceae bacterium]
MGWFDTLLAPIMWAVGWVMYGAHWVLARLGFGDGPSFAWVLAIVILTLIMRTLLIPLFVKQIRSSRAMQIIQPEMQAIQKKYKGRTDPASREAMSRETMALYKKHGTNPLASCMPMLLQSPIFFALFRLLNNIPNVYVGEGHSQYLPELGRYVVGRGPIGPIDATVAEHIMSTNFFGAHLSDVFMQTSSTQARIVVIILIVAMSLTTFTTQRQLTQKNMPESAKVGPAASMQKVMLYVLPLIFLVSGLNFPVGVLIYWLVTNLWSMGQQFFAIRNMPTPGSEAEKQFKARKAAKLARKGITIDEPVEAVQARPVGQRTQPQRKNRKKRG